MEKFASGRTNNRFWARAALALTLGALSVGLAGQATKPMPKGKNPMIGMIFCNKMQTGELCPNGTANTFKLSGETAARWKAEVHQYDNTIEAANKKMLAQARHTLSPQQYAEVKQWFAQGLNPLMNQLLVSQGRLAPTASR